MLSFFMFDSNPSGIYLDIVQKRAVDWILSCHKSLYSIVFYYILISVSRLWRAYLSTPGFLALLPFWVWQLILCIVTCYQHSWCLLTRCLYPPSPHSQKWKPQMSPHDFQCSWGQKSLLAGDYWCLIIAIGYFNYLYSFIILVGSSDQKVLPYSLFMILA